MKKFTILLKRKSTLSQAEFVEHHKTVHAQLFMSIAVTKKLVRHYIQQHAIDVDMSGMPARKYDGITELWFDSVDDIKQCFTDPEYMEVIRPDEESFLDLHGCDFIVSNENDVYKS